MAGFILGLIGLILGVIAWRKKETKTLYIIGITTSIIAFITSTMFWASIGILGIINLIF
jgi:CHASE2 domain-containing sensor protein